MSPCFARVLLKRTPARFDRIVLVGFRTVPGGAWLSTAAGEWYLFDTSVLFSVLRCARLAWARARSQGGLLATGVRLPGSKSGHGKFSLPKVPNCGSSPKHKSPQFSAETTANQHMESRRTKPTKTHPCKNATKYATGMRHPAKTRVTCVHTGRQGGGDRSQGLVVHRVGIYIHVYQ